MAGLGNRIRVLFVLGVVIIIAIVAILVMNQGNPCGSPVGGVPIGASSPICVATRCCKCPNTNFRNLRLERLVFTDGDLSGSDLSGANLAQARLNGANMHSIQAVNTDLTGADLRHTNLSNANLTGARLTNALTDNTTIFAGAIFCKTTMPDGAIRTDPGQTCP